MENNKQNATLFIYKWVDDNVVPDDTGKLSDMLIAYGNKLNISDVSGSLRYSEREIDFAYLAGVFNVSGIDGLQKEIERLKGLGKNPHDIIIAARKQ